MAKAEASVEELVGMIERGELRLPEMQRRYVWPSKISDDFQFAARMVDRKVLAKGKDRMATLSWDSMIAGEPDKEMHRNFPIKRLPPKSKTAARRACV